jgi:hypothetical protein
MILKKGFKSILEKLYRDRHIICHYMGNAKPHLCQIDDPLWPLCDSLQKRYISILISYVTNNINIQIITKEKYIEFIESLCESNIFIYFCKLLSYVVHETWVPENGEGEGLMLLASVIADSVEYALSVLLNISKKQLQKQIEDGVRNIKRQKKNSQKKVIGKLTSTHINIYMRHHHYKSAVKIQNMLSISHPRHTCLLMKSRYTLQHKPLTTLKRKMSSHENTIITKRISHGLVPTSIYDIIRPSPNHIRQVVVIELCFMQAAKLSSSRLFSLLNTINNNTSLVLGHIDVDVNNVISGLTDMARNRLQVKFIEVNKEYCTCHTKCTGYNINEILQKEIIIKGLRRDTTISCCQRCMLSPLVRNTRARKPRMKICASNPTCETCSLDNSSTFRDVPLYTADYNGFGVYRYQHLFYMTNSKNIIEELSGKKTTGPSSKLYGMCYGGSRTCLFRLQLNICSSLRKHNKTSCRVKERYLCKLCIQENKYSADTDMSIPYLFGQSIYDSGTCINMSLEELERGAEISDTVMKICTGCKLKLLCVHTTMVMITGILAIDANINIKLYKKAIKRTQFVRLLILYLMSHNG